jgi:hypothetical protein
MHTQDPAVQDADAFPEDAGPNPEIPRKRSLMWLPIRGSGFDDDPLMPDHEPAE